MGNSWAVGIRWYLMVMLAMGNPAVQVGDGFYHFELRDKNRSSQVKCTWTCQVGAIFYNVRTGGLIFFADKVMKH